MYALRLRGGTSFPNTDLRSEADIAKLVRKKELLQKMKELDIYSQVCVRAL